MKISEILVRLDELRRRRCLAEELLKKAITVFDNWCPLEDFSKNYEEYWKELLYKNLYDLNFYYKNRKQGGSIDKFFFMVTRADINREQFKELLEPFKNAVEIFIQSKKGEEEELKKDIINLYDKFFAENYKAYLFIFESDEIKQGVLEFLQKQ